MSNEWRLFGKAEMEFNSLQVLYIGMTMNIIAKNLWRKGNDLKLLPAKSRSKIFRDVLGILNKIE